MNTEIHIISSTEEKERKNCIKRKLQIYFIETVDPQFHRLYLGKWLMIFVQNISFEYCRYQPDIFSLWCFYIFSRERIRVGISIWRYQNYFYVFTECIYLRLEGGNENNIVFFISGICWLWTIKKKTNLILTYTLHLSRSFRPTAG